MLVNRSNLQIIFRNLKTSFQKAYDAAEVPVAQVRHAHRILGGAQRLFLDRVLPQDAGVGGREGHQVPLRQALRGPQQGLRGPPSRSTGTTSRTTSSGIYRPMAEMAGYSARQLPDEIMFELLSNGFSQNCYDGQFFYDTDHPVGAGMASNKGTKALNITTFQKARESYGAARVALMNMKDDEGRPLNIMPNVLVVGPALEAEARVLVTAEKFKDDDPNPYKGTAMVVVDPRVKTATEWHLIDTTKPMGALIYQERKMPVFMEQTDMGGGAIPDSVFLQKAYRYSVECRAAGGYGFWQMAYGSDGTVA